MPDSANLKEVKAKKYWRGLTISPTSFWPLHISGWAFYSLIHFLQLQVWGDAPAAKIYQYLIYYLSLLLFLSIQRYVFRDLNYRTWSFRHLIATVTLTGILLAAAKHIFYTAVISAVFNLHLTLIKQTKITELLQTLFLNSIVFIGWGGLYYGIKYWLEWNEQKTQTERAHALAQRAQLQMLRYQLNPHFLFNSLNSIRALISENKKNAKAMITELSEFLRYSLLSENLMEVPLKQEIDAIQHYYAIEKRRFESKLDIHFEIEPRAEEFPIISFLIHPLVENAIKYGMRTSNLPLQIWIRATFVDHTLCVEVTNTGHWIESNQGLKQPGDSTGTGLENVRRRLESAYAQNYCFKIDKLPEHVTVRFEIHKKCESYDEETL